MYNSHVLEECDTEVALENILTQSDSTAIFIDPPFGGRLEPLAYTLAKFDKIRKNCNKSPLSSKNIFFYFYFLLISIIYFLEFLVLPYFMERFVINCLPGMTMLDYKVDYVNHKKFNSSG